MKETRFCREIIQREYLKRKSKNQAYSLRAFSNYLGIGIASLSSFIAGKRNLSKKNMIKVADRLSLPPLEQELFISQANKKTSSVDIERLQLQEDTFHLISDWYHYGILELCAIKSHKNSSSWVAWKLGISELEATLAINRLMKLGLLKKRGTNFYRDTPPLTTKTDVPDRAIRSRHHQILELAKISLEHDPIDKRHFWETTFALSPEKYEEAKKLIIASSRKIVKLLESGTPKEVYSLSINLFPLKKDRSV
ncbi:MAG: TIGR02147 family protein [Bdellovibrio sp.]|nr:TIGR02147 family protein [Bdellovibrio sp.]